EDSRCKYHVSLILKRWFKEELQDETDLRTVTGPESFQVAFPHRRSIPSTREHPTDTYMGNVHSLFTAESSIPPSSKESRRRKREYAEVIRAARYIASKIRDDRALYRELVNALKKIESSAKRRREGERSSSGKALENIKDSRQ
ncbi:hypothetical protein BGZ80_007596, partial [Entomortierella chlamydospora]